MLRDGLLDGVTVMARPRTDATQEAERLGATVGDEPSTHVVIDARAWFVPADRAALHAALDATWDAVRAAAPWEREGGPVVLIGPPPAAGLFAQALREGLEKLARVLSVEWSSRVIRPVAVLPADATSDADLATLVAYLLSPAGAYFSGTALTLTDDFAGPVRSTRP